MTESERQARFRSRMRALANEPERLPSGNYRDACADCGQVMIARSAAELDAARCVSQLAAGFTWSEHLTPPTVTVLGGWHEFEEAWRDPLWISIRGWAICLRSGSTRDALSK